MSTVLIVEDEKPIRQMLGFALGRAGFESMEAQDARQAREHISVQRPDLILMDWMLPDTSGIELTRRLKKEINTQHIPIIMLTARTEESDKITGLNAGADDYVSKPFSPGELIARIQAVMRRARPASTRDVIEYSKLQLDNESHRVSVDGTTLELGPTEFRLLRFFMQHPDRVYSREQLLDHAWGRNIYVEERTVDVHILRLRKNLSPWGYDKYIQTVRGAGYRFSPAD